MIGQTLGHYLILEKIGAGGMGIVYQARDQKLDRLVALKVLATANPTDDLARRRFRREALALSQLNHPNIATVFDFDSQDDLDFLVMEFVTGETLSQKVAQGPLSETEVLVLAVQICKALEEAHERGLIHRDLKPANIMVNSKGLVKVLDFGLAMLVQTPEDKDRTISMSQVRGMAGTLPYMAPEQVLGEELDRRTDLYALGVVLFEMATGYKPFAETQNARLINSILHTPAPLPTQLNANVSAGLSRIIGKALAKSPGDRYQLARELIEDLELLNTATLPLPVIPKPRRPRRGLLIGILVVALLTVVLAVQLWTVRKSPRPVTEESQTPLTVRRAVAVLGFKNISGRPDAGWLSTAFSEMLTTELAAGGKLRTIPGETVARMKTDLVLPDAESYEKTTLSRIRSNLGADLVILGSYLALGGADDKPIRLDLRVQDAVAGETLILVSERGKETELLDLISRAGARLRETLGVGELPAAESEGVRASLPSNPEAARLYVEGLDKLRLFEALTARNLVQRALAIEPGHALAHAALASAWSTLGYDRDAREEARKAFNLSAKLTREQRLSVEGRYRVTVREWPKAVEIYKTLFGFFSDNLDYGVHLATTQTSAGDGKSALQTITTLRKLPAPLREDPRIDLAEALATASRSDFALAQAAASRAISSGEAKGARSLIAQARLLQGQALWKLGRLVQAAESFKEAKRLFDIRGDRWGATNAMTNLGVVLGDQGDLAGAGNLYSESLATYREIGNRKGTAAALTSLAILLRKQGESKEAMKNYREALQIYREIGDQDSAALTLNNLANLLGEQGKFTEAKKIYEEALGIFRELANKNAVATVLGNLGDVMVEEGDLTQARKEYEQSLAVFRETGNRSSVASRLALLGDLQLIEGDLAGARQRHLEALAIREQLGEKGTAAESQLAVARLLLQEKQFSGAEGLCRSAIEEFRREERTEDEASARALLSQLLLAQGKSAEARNEINHASFLLKTSQSVRLRYSAMIAAASIGAASGEASQAIHALDKVIADVTRAGLIQLQLEARLAAGQIEMASGRIQSGRDRLKMLERDAAAKGYGLIARKAATASTN
jgi:serine/threonine protein kinase/tetratricopeptide (TPR) repeat protein